MMSHRRRRILLLSGLLLLLAAVVYLSPLRQVFHPAARSALEAWIVALGPWAPFMFVLMTAMVVAAGAPRLLMAVLGGAVFGWFAGGMLTLLGTLIGCWITFTYARWLGYDWLQARLGPRLSRFNAVFRRHGFLMTFGLRCAPVGNCHMMNLMLAFSPISCRAFLLGTMCGVLPTTTLYALFGSAAGGSWFLRVTTASVLLIALGLIYTLIASRSQRVRDILTQFANQK
ncbi:MAG: VTT domain-containing protein [Candidatus Tectomicrobia bacterium]|nr:VTT domain-containing protein [Candidatus Tectomicrobia bacterium]